MSTNQNTNDLIWVSREVLDYIDGWSIIHNLKDIPMHKLVWMGARQTLATALLLCVKWYDDE
jgi:hypothetical protein